MGVLSEEKLDYRYQPSLHEIKMNYLSLTSFVSVVWLVSFHCLAVMVQLLVNPANQEISNLIMRQLIVCLVFQENFNGNLQEQSVYFVQLAAHLQQLPESMTVTPVCKVDTWMKLVLSIV